MTPPEHQGQGNAEPPEAPLAVLSYAPPAIQTLRQRADFLRAASARRQSAGGFLVQARNRGDGAVTLRVGFTASKKVGNAVFRNRAKRRLREIARAILPRLGHAGWDYVLVARPGVTVDRPFADLLSDLETALRAIHKERTGDRTADRTGDRAK